MRRFVVALIAALIGGCAPAMQDLPPKLSASDSGTVWFSTTGSLVRASATNGRLIPGPPIAISGDLQFPSGPGPFPSVVLAHGCGGVGNAERGWAPELRRWGYASLVIDSFGPRNIREVCTNPETLSPTRRIPDGYGALKILATHPKIEPNRIALMGFSHGGSLTVGAATIWARDTYARDGQPRFRAFFPFYPGCVTSYPERTKMSAPVRIHIGALDDWTPAEPCRELAEALRASGQDVTITIYTGAHHSFDNVGRNVTRRPDVFSAADCRIRLASILGPVLNADEARTCVKKGATVGWNAEAMEEARKNVRAQLTELLK